MLVGTVAFPGQNPAQVYSDICERKIQWPRPEILQHMMSKEAVDLVNAMIQIDPSKRLGNNLESISNLKTHPFFNKVNFEEVSSP